MIQTMQSGCPASLARRSVGRIAAALVAVLALSCPAHAHDGGNNCIRLVNYGEESGGETGARSYDLGYRKLSLPANAANARLTLEIGSVDADTLKRPVILKNESTGATARFTAKIETRNIYVLSTENDAAKGDFRFVIALGYRTKDKDMTLLNAHYRKDVTAPLQVELTSYPSIGFDFPAAAISCLTHGQEP